MGGERVWAAVMYRYTSAAERCPHCEAVIRVAIASVGDGVIVFRLECLACGWMTEALPDPEAI